MAPAQATTLSPSIPPQSPPPSAMALAQATTLSPSPPPTWLPALPLLEEEGWYTRWKWTHLHKLVRIPYTLALSSDGTAAPQPPPTAGSMAGCHTSSLN